ncbi:MFS transporter [Beijerinckia sp. L45]|uniref:MFS transporter n=1 Tax=Beijerinckia sp. L45 TaxID=1641855 RepID=UPI001AEDE172|nr:MFS transporter [Beijerinckia sp. L45]
MTGNALPMSSTAMTRAHVFNGLAPMVAIVFFGFVAIAAPLAALSLELHDRLGFAPVVVGCVVGLQSVATLLTRHAGGSLSDVKGPRHAVLIGLPLTALAGAINLVSTSALISASGALALILVGRLCMGFGESLFITGAMAWGIARIGPQNTSKVMSWQGVAMYGAIGIGAPLGLAVQRSFGFSGVALVSIVTPMLAWAVALACLGVPGGGGDRVPFYRVIGLIWRPGLVVTLAAAPFAALTAFVALDYADHGWTGAGLALAGFGFCYVLVRLLFSHWPDRFGGIRITGITLCLEAAGQALLWLAPSPAFAFAGACLTGLGFSLVFPSMGVEAMRQVSPDQRGRAVGNFIAFFDLAIGFTAPIVGLVAGRFGFQTAFLIGMGAALLAASLVPGVRRGTA